MINKLLMDTLSPIAPTSADVYDGGKSTYIVFNYNSIPDDFGDDAPGHEVFTVQVHLFCPLGINSLTLRREIKAAIHTVGFTWPAYINASDKDGQHHVFESEYTQAPGVD